MSSPLNPLLIVSIRSLLAESRQQLQTAVNSAMVQTYWHIGRLIVEDEQAGALRAEYGAQQLAALGRQLKTEFGSGFDASNLRNMRQFYSMFPIRDALRRELGWTHYRALIRIENPAARAWYADEAIAANWSARALERQISTLYYERLLASSEPAPVRNEAQSLTAPLEVSAKQVLRDPYILDFLNLPSTAVLESTVEKGLIEHLQQFLMELGRGFAFVARQQRISVDDQDFYLDLVFYNFKLKCFLLIDLKMGKLSHQDIGQMDTYIRIYDQHYKQSDDNPTIGLILCSEKSQALAKYSVLADSQQLFAAKYLPFLPSEDELRRQLLLERAD